MELDDQIDRVGREYLDNAHVLTFTPRARQVAFEILRRRDGLPAGLDAEPTGRDVAIARQNAVRILREAEQIARSRRVRSVDDEMVSAAFLKLCPGLYPFC
jgi:hypothetical protein